MAIKDFSELEADPDWPEGGLINSAAEIGEKMDAVMIGFGKMVVINEALVENLIIVERTEKLIMKSLNF